MLVASALPIPFQPPEAAMPRWLFWCYESLMAALAVVVIVLIRYPSDGVVGWVNLGIWAVFTVDYVVRFKIAKEPGRFFQENVFDLVAILPVDLVILGIDHLVTGHAELLAKFPPGSFEFLRAFRLARSFRVLRLFRVFRGVAFLLRAFSHARGVLQTRGLQTVLGLVSLFVVVMGIAVTFFESKIGMWYDGVWWGVVTAATVGYGDYAPVTWEGRVIAVLLMLVGIGTLGTLTGSIATYFMGQGRTSANPHVRHVQTQLDRWDEMSPEERRQTWRFLRALAEGAED